MAVHLIKVEKAIRIEEIEDEGVTIIVLTSDGETILFSSQELKESFPWKEFEIIEAPHSKILLNLRRLGDSIHPKEMYSLSDKVDLRDHEKMNGIYKVLDVDFHSLIQTIHH